MPAALVSGSAAGAVAGPCYDPAVMPAAQAVRRMFGAIAPRYDLLNRLLSAGVDRRWRRRAVALAEVAPGERALDVCSGTGDLALELARAGAEVVGADFVAPMIARAERKRGAAPSGGLARFLLADALELPFRDGAFDVVSVGFGIRNVESLDGGLREMARVLRPGGRAVVLEFTTPPNRIFRRAFGFYFHRCLPRLGNALAGVETDAYSYLPESVEAFPDAPALAARLTAAGLVRVRFHYLSAGIAAVHVGERPAAPPR